MSLPLSYSLRSLRHRLISNAFAAAGIALVVAVFLTLIALADGFRQALMKTGSSRNAIILSGASTTEIDSRITPEEIGRILARAERLAELSRDGQPLAGAEFFTVVNPSRRGNPNEFASVALRGISLPLDEIRPGIRLAEGRWFERGKGELVVGRHLQDKILNCELGQALPFGSRDWTIVGITDSGGTEFDSTIFGDAQELVRTFDRQGNFQSVVVRLKQLGDLETLRIELANESQLDLVIHREQEYYESMAAGFQRYVFNLGLVTCGLLALGAVAGGLNSMTGIVLARTREIGVLRAVGFSARAILIGFLSEALIVSVLGGLGGCLLALASDGVQATSTAGDGRSELSFAFHVDKLQHFTLGLLFAVTLGLLSGFIPALKAANQKITSSLRSE